MATRAVRASAVTERRATIGSALVIAALVAAVIIAIAASTCRDQERKNECRVKGGRVVETNCRTITTCTTQDFGNGVHVTTCTPNTVCDWKCIGLPAEDPR